MRTLLSLLLAAALSSCVAADESDNPERGDQVPSPDAAAAGVADAAPGSGGTTDAGPGITDASIEDGGTTDAAPRPAPDASR